MPENTNSIESRVSSLETSVGTLVQSVQILSDEVRRDLSILRVTVNEVGQPKWSTYIGFAAVLLTIVGMVGGAVGIGYSSDQRRVEGRVDGIMDRALNLEFERGRSMTETRALMQATEHLDTRLQREMRDVNMITEAKLAALDKRLQDEIARATANMIEHRHTLQELVESLRGSQVIHRENTARNDERLRAIERDLMGDKGSPKPR